MAPRKRVRDVDDLDGDVEVESASSNFRQSGPKRSRTELAQLNGGSVVSDEDSEDDVEDLLDDHEPERGYSDSDDDSIDELVATQVVQKQFKQVGENVAAENGIVEEILCVNFMCHKKLRIVMGPLINFIIGHNGSGKSAILTALTMCLGGKATATNRGAKLKDLIKEGQDSAMLSVSIKNQGEGAYKPDVYGKRITVERHFNQSGTSGFKLKNERDKVISTKKFALDDILDYFAFQLDNPINVLTQDMARQFLANSTPTDKYKFFIRGTQLEVLDADYKLMEEHLNNITVKLATRDSDIAVLKQRFDEAEAQKKRMDKVDGMREALDRLRFQHAWAQVEEQEQRLENVEAAVRAAAQRIQEKTEAAEAVDGAFEGHNQTYEAYKRTLEGLQEQLRPAVDAAEEAKAEFEKAKKDVIDVGGQHRDCREQMKIAKRNISRLKDDIQREKDLLAGAEGDEHVARLEELESLKAQVAAKRQELDDHRNGLAALQSRKDEAFKAAEETKTPWDEAKKALADAESRLKGLEQGQGRPWADYRPRMDELVRAVEKETRWRNKPVGPMASHIHLQDPQWLTPLEAVLGAAAEAFIVTSKEDQNLLSGIMRRVNCHPPIYIGNATPLNTERREPAPEVDTMLRILRIDNGLVRNMLIINQSAEQLALIVNESDARDFMFHGPSPVNVKATMAIRSDGVSGVRLDRSGRGAERSSHVPGWRGRPRMKTDIQDQVKRSKQAVNAATRGVDECREAHRRMQEALKEATAALISHEKHSKLLRRQLEEVEDAVEAQENLIEAKRPEDGKLQEYENQLRHAEDELEGQEQSYQDIVNAKDAKGERSRLTKEALDAAEHEKQALQKNVDKAENRLASMELERQQALREKNLAIALIDSAKQEQAELESSRDDQARVVQQYTAAATEISPRVNVPDGLTAEILDAKVTKFIDEVHRAERSAGGTREEVMEAWQKARQEHADAVNSLKTMNIMAVAMRKSLDERRKRWKRFRSLITTRARETFSFLLSERQFRGRLIADHSNKMLDIKVEPDLTKESDVGRQTKTLSGGEKSFSTICLLLSIWEAMGSPIRCLDEFDVFMDSVNRDKSMGMMIEAARRSVGRQFVLITPQAMGTVQLGADVKVHKLGDPERGQQVLSF